MGYNPIAQYNRFAPKINPLMQKALTSSPSSGGALIPEHLEKVITNTVIQLMPELQMLKYEYDPQSAHKYNQVTQLAPNGGAMGENAVTPKGNTTFARQQEDLKIVRRIGAVTNFLRDASQKYIDAAAIEMEYQLRAHAIDLGFYNYFGNKTANPYEYSGWNRAITTNRDNSGFTAGAPTKPTSLAFIDNLIDGKMAYGGEQHDSFIAMSPEMLSTVSALLTNVRLNQGQSKLGEINIAGGWRLMTYRDIPILSTSYLSSKRSGTMGTVTATTASTGGFLSDGTYYFRVNYYDRQGESMASAQVAITISAGTATQRITLSWTAVANAYAFKISASTTTGITNTKPIDWIPNFTYNSDGTPTQGVTSYIVTTMTPTASVSNMLNDIPFSAASSVNAESVVLIDTDPYQGLGKFAYTHSAGNRFDGLVQIEELSKIDDFLQFLVKTYGTIVPSFEASSSWTRGWRAS